MGRPRKKGLDYFPVDVDIFEDFAVRILISRYGADGFALYMYILTKAYKDPGYYLVKDDDLEYLISTDLKMSAEKVRQILAYLFRRSLLVEVTSTLPVPVTVITSAGIQRRYQQAVRERAAKNPVEVDAEFWLLEEKETESFIKVLPSFDNSGNNESFSGKNTGFSGKKCIKKSKVKNSKEKKNKSIAEPYLSNEESNTLFGKYLAMWEETESLSDEQISQLIGKLIELTEDPAEQCRIIREAIIHRWKSFYPVRKEPAGDKAKKGFCNFEQRQRSKEEEESLERALLGLPNMEGTG